MANEPRIEVALDDVMNALARFDLRESQLVEMHWNTAKTWLYRELAGGAGHGL